MYKYTGLAESIRYNCELHSVFAMQNTVLVGVHNAVHFFLQQGFVFVGFKNFFVTETYPETGTEKRC